METYFVRDDSGMPAREYYATPLEDFRPGACYQTVELDGEVGEAQVPENYDGPHESWNEYFG